MYRKVRLAGYLRTGQDRYKSCGGGSSQGGHERTHRATCRQESLTVEKRRETTLQVVIAQMAQESRAAIKSLPSRRFETGVSPSAARALPCRAARAGASAPVVEGRRVCCWVALATVRAVWQPSGAPSWVRPRPDHPHCPELVARVGSPEVALVQGGAPGRRRPNLMLLPVAAVVQVVAVVVVVAWPARVRRPAPDAVIGGAGRRGPPGPGHAGAPAPALTAGGVR